MCVQVHAVEFAPQVDQHAHCCCNCQGGKLTHIGSAFQNDLLGHPNVKVFVTQCGSNSFMGEPLAACSAATFALTHVCSRINVPWNACACHSSDR